jgi:hypothetical protein
MRNYDDDGRASLLRWDDLTLQEQMFYTNMVEAFERWLQNKGLIRKDHTAK